MCLIQINMATNIPSDADRLLAQLTAELRERTEQLCTANLDLERTHDLTLEALGDMLELHDAETENHSKRVFAFSIALARAMYMPVENIRDVARGAFLHDLGKIATPAAILRKAGALTAEEARIVREHCAHGYQVIRRIPFLAEAAEIVYAHHERWDGTGYPRNLAGNDIPLGARIVAITNALDSIMSNHPYRAAQSAKAARHEIVRCSGQQFDPEVVGVFREMSTSIWEYLRHEIMEQLVYRVSKS